MKKTLSHPAFTGAIAAAAVLLNVITWQINNARKSQADQQVWQISIETRLTRLETKMDRLLAVTDHALRIARDRLPQRPMSE
jgi:hypothetical protein